MQEYGILHQTDVQQGIQKKEEIEVKRGKRLLSSTATLG